MHFLLINVSKFSGVAKLLSIWNAFSLLKNHFECSFVSSECSLQSSNVCFEVRSEYLRWLNSEQFDRLTYYGSQSGLAKLAHRKLLERTSKQTLELCNEHLKWFFKSELQSRATLFNLKKLHFYLGLLKKGINHKIASNHWQSNQINFGITSWIFFEKTQMCSIYREKLKCPRFIEKNPNVLDLSRKHKHPRLIVKIQMSSIYQENPNVLDLSRKLKCPRYIVKIQMSSIYREKPKCPRFIEKTQMSSIYRENSNVLDLSRKTQMSSIYRENPNILKLSGKPKCPQFIEKTQISLIYRENTNIVDLSWKFKCPRFIKKTQMFSIYRENPNVLDLSRKPKCPRFIKKFQMSLVNQ